MAGALANVGSAHFSVYNFSQEARLATSREHCRVPTGWSGPTSPRRTARSTILTIRPTTTRARNRQQPGRPRLCPERQRLHPVGPGLSRASARRVRGADPLPLHRQALSLTGGASRPLRCGDTHSLVYQDGLPGRQRPPDVTDPVLPRRGQRLQGEPVLQAEPGCTWCTCSSPKASRPGFGRAPLPTECDTEAGSAGGESAARFDQELRDRRQDRLARSAPDPRCGRLPHQLERHPGRASASSAASGFRTTSAPRVIKGREL